MPWGRILPITKQHGGQENEIVGRFKNEMKAKRRQTGDGVGKKNEEGNVLERQVLVAQRLSSEVSNK